LEFEARKLVLWTRSTKWHTKVVQSKINLNQRVAYIYSNHYEKVV